MCSTYHLQGFSWPWIWVGFRPTVMSRWASGRREREREGMRVDGDDGWHNCGSRRSLQQKKKKSMTALLQCCRLFHLGSERRRSECKVLQPRLNGWKWKKNQPWTLTHFFRFTAHSNKGKTRPTGFNWTQCSLKFWLEHESRTHALRLTCNLWY